MFLYWLRIDMAKSTIAPDALDAVVPTKKPRKGGQGTQRTKREPLPKPQQKERLTVHVPVDLIDRVKNAVYWTPGVTLAGLSEEGLTKAVQRLEKKHNQGKPFAKRKAELKGGRPLK